MAGAGLGSEVNDKPDSGTSPQGEESGQAGKVAAISEMGSTPGNHGLQDRGCPPVRGTQTPLQESGRQ